VISSLGLLDLSRAYYHCDKCNEGFCPRDRTFGFEDASMSPALQRMVALVGATVPFEEGEELLEKLAGVSVEAKRVERTAEALGAEVACDERDAVEPAGDDEIAPTLYLGLDGTGVPMRKSEVEGRQGKHKDGTAKTRETKLCTIWSAESRDAEGKPMRDDGSVTYSAGIESAAIKDTERCGSEFRKRVLRETRRRGFDRARRQVVMGDGAKWIWNLADEFFPDAVQIVDIFHAKDHIFKAATAIYGPGSDLGPEWGKQRRDELDRGDIDTVIAELRIHATRIPEAESCIKYLDNNRTRMRYPEFRALGLCVSTGVVEAGCKHAIGARLKRAGMHWTLRGAGAIIALRCAKLSGRLPDFFERRAGARLATWASAERALSAGARHRAGRQAGAAGSGRTPHART
jgi:hypothetical protein